MREGAGRSRDSLGAARCEPAHGLEEPRVLEAGGEERPPVGACLVSADVVEFVGGEHLRRASLERLDVELELTREELVDRVGEIEELVDGPLAALSLTEVATSSMSSVSRRA